MKRIFILIVGLLFYLVTLSAQEATFLFSNQNLPISATGINSMDVESADVDNDGDLDVIIAGEASRNLLFFNDGQGVFTQDFSRLFPKKNPMSAFAGEDSEDIALADFDQDGDLDVLFVSEDTEFHELLINDGSGDFTHIPYNFESSKGNAVAVLDLNGDTFPDVIIGNTGQNEVYINNQNLTFTKENDRWPINTEGTQDLKLADLDNDGDLDIIEGIDIGSNNILINTNGFFEEANERLPEAQPPMETRKITLGDINGDEAPDIFVSTVNFTGASTLQNQLYLNDGNGFFTDVTATNIPDFEQQTLDALFLDYDFDNDLDLITLGFVSFGNSYKAFENDGTGVFTEQTLNVLDAFAMTNGIALHSADFNGDTFPDLYFGGFNQQDDLLFYNPNIVATTEMEYADTMELFPNPVQEILHLRLPEGNDLSNVRIEIFSIKGQLIYSQYQEHMIGALHSINVEALPSGEYWCRLVQTDKVVFNGRFVIAK